MRNAILSKTISFLVVSLFIMSCSGTKDQAVIVKQKSPNDAVLLDQPSDNEPTEALINERHSQSSKRYIVAFNGHVVAYEDRLYTISSRADKGFADEFRLYPLRFLEIAASGRTNILYAIVQEHRKKSIIQFNTKTSYPYVLVSDAGEVFDLKASPDSTQIAYLKIESNRRVSLNIYNLTKRKSIKKIFNHGETILSLKFTPDSGSVVIAKQSGQASAFLNISISESSFGRAAILLQKRRVSLSDPILFDEGQQVIYIEKSASLVDQAAKLILRDLNTQKETLIDEAEAIFEPSLSPDGMHLTFWSRSKDEQPLRHYALKTQRIKTITHLRVPRKGQVFYRKKRVHPIWTPDSKAILYSNFDGWNGQIYKYELLSGNIKKMTENIYTDFYYPIILGEERL